MPDGPTKREPKKPWGGLAALFAAGLVTLIGVYQGLEPATILLRAFPAGVLLGVLTSVVSAYLSSFPRPS